MADIVTLFQALALVSAGYTDSLKECMINRWINTNYCLLISAIIRCNKQRLESMYEQRELQRVMSNYLS